MPEFHGTLLRRSAALCLLLGLAAVVAATPTVPALSGRVVDRAGILSAAGRGRIETAIIQVEAATGGQMAVLTVPSLEGDAIEDFSIRVAEQWKIGRKGQDNGLILVVARDNRAMRLEVGYGWEGKINDARAGDIIRGMQPLFRAGRFDDGVLYAVGQVHTMLTGRPLAGIPMPRAGQPARGPPGWLIIIIIIVVLLLLSAVSNSRLGRGMVLDRHGSSGGGFWSSGGSSGSSGGGGFSGGGGGFGGGGASGRW